MIQYTVDHKNDARGESRSSGVLSKNTFVGKSFGFFHFWSWDSAHLRHNLLLMLRLHLAVLTTRNETWR